MACAERAAKSILIHELFSWDNDFIRINGKTDVTFAISKPYLNQLLLNLIDHDPGEEYEVSDKEVETAPPSDCEPAAGLGAEKGPKKAKK
jgi:hypothetical protein